MEITFFVQGSASEPYFVVFKKTDVNITASCTCRAGIFRQYCKHRVRIMLGDPTGIVSENISEVSDIQSWLCGTDVEKALLDLREAEQQLEEAKRHVSISKKRLARTLKE